jgi:hypothetical protein
MVVLDHALMLSFPLWDLVRLPHPLAQFPDAERREWQKLWAEVEELRQRPATAQPNIGRGFIQAWLLLSELVPYEGKDGVKTLDRQQISREALLRPRAGDRVEINGKTLLWKEHQSAEDYIDFGAVYGPPSEHRLAYAVCYVHANADREDLTLYLGSDDQAKLYLNGKLIHRQPAVRELVLNEDEIRSVALRKGTNVLVFKVVNERAAHQGSLRFLTKDGKVPEGIEYRLSP